MSRPALGFSGVTVVRDGHTAIRDLTWRVERGERWVVLGPNGSGKTTLVQLASGYLHPTRGTVHVLGHRLGRVDVRDLRRRIGLVSGAVTRMIRPGATALDVVLSGRHAALETWWHEYADEDHERARTLLDEAGFAALADRPFGVLSEGERQQVLLARALMGTAELVLLDEPAAGLDLGAREQLVARLASVAGDPAAPPLVFVTHHVEEVPEAFTHALLLSRGTALAAGPLRATLTSECLSAAFGLPLSVTGDGGRFACRAVRR